MEETKVGQKSDPKASAAVDRCDFFQHNSLSLVIDDASFVLLFVGRASQYEIRDNTFFSLTK